MHFGKLKRVCVDFSGFSGAFESLRHAARRHSLIVACNIFVRENSTVNTLGQRLTLIV